MKKLEILKTGIIIATTSIILLGANVACAVETNVPDVNNLIFDYQTQEATTTPVTTDYIASLPDTNSPLNFIGKVSYFLLIIANILCFVSFVASGVFMVMSMGDAEMLKKAKGIFTYTLLAMIICATALAMVTGITNIKFFNP